MNLYFNKNITSDLYLSGKGLIKILRKYMSKEELTEKFTNLNFNELSGEINSSCAKIQEFKGILSYIKNLEDQYKDQDRSFEFYFSFYSGCWDGIGEFLKEVENEKMKKQNFEELSKKFIKNLFDNIGLKKFEEYFTDKSTFETIAKLKDICKDTEECDLPLYE